MSSSPRVVPPRSGLITTLGANGREESALRRVSLSGRSAVSVPSAPRGWAASVASAAVGATERMQLRGRSEDLRLELMRRSWLRRACPLSVLRSLVAGTVAVTDGE